MLDQSLAQGVAPGWPAVPPKPLEVQTHPDQAEGPGPGRGGLGDRRQRGSKIWEAHNYGSRRFDRPTQTPAPTARLTSSGRPPPAIGGREKLRNRPFARSNAWLRTRRKSSPAG
jgi:hypothetical protein